MATASDDASSGEAVLASQLGDSAVLFGYVFDEAGMLPDSGVVSLIPVDYRPSRFGNSSKIAAAQVMRDSLRAGVYSFAEIDSGYYNLIASDLTGHMAMIESLLVPPADGYAPCYLSKAGGMKGSIVDSSGPVPESTFVYLNGTEFNSYVIGDKGLFNILGIPAGDFEVGLEYPVPAMSPDSIKVASDSLGIPGSVPFYTYAPVDVVSYTNEKNDTVSKDRVSVTTGDTLDVRIEINTNTTTP